MSNGQQQGGQGQGGQVGGQQGGQQQGGQGQGEQQAKSPVVKSPQDPVKVKCGKVEWPKQDPTKPPVDHGPLPKEVSFSWRGQTYTVPVGGVQKDTMPREAAEFMLQRAARYWTLKAELSILEPRFE